MPFKIRDKVIVKRDASNLSKCRGEVVGFERNDMIVVKFDKESLSHTHYVLPEGSTVNLVIPEHHIVLDTNEPPTLLPGFVVILRDKQVLLVCGSKEGNFLVSEHHYNSFTQYESIWDYKNLNSRVLDQWDIMEVYGILPTMTSYLHSLSGRELLWKRKEFKDAEENTKV